MPVKISDAIPAASVLTSENIFFINESRAVTQDIRPLKIGILNLMPLKSNTETQLLRLLGNTPLQVEPTFIITKSYTPKNTTKSYLDAFYSTFDEVRNCNYDGFIITGAPVEQLPFEDVEYWKEVVNILDWLKSHSFSNLFICWGAQAALHHYYGIQKHDLEDKAFGVFKHKLNTLNFPITRGFDDYFYAPHSRHTTIKKEDVNKQSDLIILGESSEAGLYLLSDPDMRCIYLLGHPEYERYTLDEEYKRDKSKGLKIDVPIDYYLADDPDNRPNFRWKSHANLLFSNWLNHVYQETPYDLSKLSKL